MEKAYAAALWKAVENGKNPKEAVVALQAILLRRGRTALFPKIARAFRRFSERERAKNTLTLSLAHAHDLRARKEALHALEALGLSKDTIEVETNDSQIGGWRLEGKGLLIDASFKKHLLSMYNRTTQS